MRTPFLLALLWMLLAGPAAASAQVDQDEGGVIPAPHVEDATLLPGDALQIQIWREPDLGGTFVLDPQGAVTLPLLGRVQVAWIPLAELREMLVELYQVELRNASIEITPLRRVYVLGEVNRPGLLALDPTVTLAGAVAMAGGANPTGDLRKLRIMRDGEVLRDRVGPEQDLMSVDIRSGDQIFVERRGWFDRNSTFVVSATIGIAGIIVQLLR
jgi:protein involved in polysaccharide export with SLBB domain